MKPEEELKELSYDSTAYGGKCTSEVRKVAVKAMKKQIPMNPKDFYGYRRKTVAVLYERMKLFGVWEE